MKRSLTFFMFLCVMSLLSFPHEASAHATFMSSIPAKNTQVDATPNEVSITFNEGVDLIGDGLKLYDSNGNRVFEQKAALRDGKKTLYLSTPNLPDDTYTASYLVLSEDSHPVLGAYVFTIGDVVHATKEVHTGADPFVDKTYQIYRTLVFTLFFVLLGLVYWSGKLTRISRFFYVIVTFLFVFLYLFQLYYYAGELDVRSMMDAAVSTHAGLIWTSLTMLLIIGAFALSERRLLRFPWLLLVVLLQSMNGHALSHGTAYVTVLLYMVHIFAAIVWSGGVVLLSIRRKDPRFEEFVSLFSRHALISLLLLIITGVLQTLIIEPDLSELFSTSWGIYLVIKVGAVVLVLLLGAYLRRIIKQKHFSLFKRLLRVDLVLVFVIAILASLISMLNPNPPAKPLNWQDHDAAYAYSVVIDEGRYTISVKMLDASLGIKRVELDVFNKTYPDLGKQTVELSKQVDGTYSGAGAYMTIPGVWDVQLRVMDLSYSEHVYNKAHVIR